MRQFILIVFTIGLILGFTSITYADGTLAGTDITNQATITYAVDGVDQTPVVSNTTSFVVDNRINLTVTLQNSSYEPVAPGETSQVLTLRDGNTGNSTQDFMVSADQLISGTADPFGGSDNSDVAFYQVYVDENDNDTYDNGTDTAGHINALPPDISIEVFVVATIEASPTVGNGDIAAIELTALARENDGADTLGNALTETTGSDTPGTVDIVFGDTDGDSDSARDAAFSDTGAYQVVSAEISIGKTSTVIRDPFNGDTNPKHIPGAYVRYTVTISNADSAGASATLTEISDTLNSNTAFDADLIAGSSGNPESSAGSGFVVSYATNNADARPSLSSPVYRTTTNSDADGTAHDGSTTGGTVTIAMNDDNILPAEGSWTVGELKPGESVSISYNVIIR